ncbi:MAG: L7Ae/L30e/S12e/Gadd45 family ribosomal protein [Lachnospiraceae bacterium]|nr:L7Ae/L30e/S12e/Gadd45 family ribosomal protein [Lachnospiraceae bacterium]
MNRDKALNMLSIAAKGRNLSSGEFQTEESIKDGKACLVIVAGDASENTKKHFSDMCSYYQVPLIFYSNREELGRAIGKEFRALVAVNDKGIADRVLVLTDNKE